MNMTRFNANGEEIKPGLRQRHQTNFDSIKFEYHLVLDQENPDQWHAEVSLKGRTVLRTGQFPSEYVAGKAAEDALLEHLVGLLSA